MTKYILHGGYSGIDNELNRTFYEEVARDISNGSTILLCYFASDDPDNPGRFEEHSRRLQEQSTGKEFTFLLASEQNFVEQLQQSEAVFVGGGSTSKLLRILKKFGNLEENLIGKTVAGSSAGAYAIVKYSPFHDVDEPGGEVREGLGLLPLKLACHYESENLPPNPEALALLKSMAPELELVFLRDFEWWVWEG